MAERLVDFACSDATMDWHPIDDVVMGGVSQSAMQPYSRGIACFGGVVSLEHGGGFASVRTEPRKWEHGGRERLRACAVVAMAGSYKFTVRTDDGFDGVQYQARFQPPRGEWAEVELPVDELRCQLSRSPGARVPVRSIRRWSVSLG